MDFGSVPPTRQQLETARVVAVFCRGLVPIDDNYVMTHAEAADIDDYGPATTFERWDLWKLASADGTARWRCFDPAAKRKPAVSGNKSRNAVGSALRLSVYLVAADRQLR
ncbi:MAG: hypothetical protein ACLR2G_04650 [Phascolarctobacterium faecium]